ncbi:hypothetical protein BG011_002172, partial [Mortierella polycephala]
LFGPWLWTRVELHRHHDRGQRNVLRRHGSHVRTLDNVLADKKTLQFIREFCPHLTCLSMTMNHSSSWITYGYLETFFSRMPQLTTLQVQLDASKFSPVMLWSLSQLPNLISLTIDIFYSLATPAKRYQPDDYMTILECCPHLQELANCGSFLESTDTSTVPAKSPFPQWVRNVFGIKQMGIASDTLEADEILRHSRSWSAGTATSVFRQKPWASNPKANPSLLSALSGKGANTYKIRKLDLQSPRMDDKVFCRLTTRCPLLEELNLDGVWVRISNASWTLLSAQCTRLRSLTVRNSGTVRHLPSLQDIMALFPRLESATMSALAFHRDPDLSDLATTIQNLENQQGSIHPLKHIHISGSIHRPLKVLLDIVTQSPTVESLTVGFTMNAIRPLGHGVDVPYELHERWRCQDTLTYLDLTSVSFADRTSFSKFFGHVQRLSRLKSLSLSITHVREARDITIANLGKASRHQYTTSSSSSACRSSSLFYNSPSVSTPAFCNFTSESDIHGSFFCFQTLQTLCIGMSYSLHRNEQWSDPPVVFEEVVFMLDVTPALRRLNLKHMSQSGVIKRLAIEFPRICFS